MKKLPLKEIAHHAGKLGFRWFAVDESEDVYAFHEKPTSWVTAWCSESCIILGVKVSDCIDWKQSLTKCEVE